MRGPALVVLLAAAVAGGCSAPLAPMPGSSAGGARGTAYLDALPPFEQGGSGGTPQPIDARAVHAGHRIRSPTVKQDSFHNRPSLTVGLLILVPRALDDRPRSIADL